MMSKKELEVAESNQTVAAEEPRTEYVLKTALIQNGVVRQPGEKVMLKARQAEELRKLGVI